MDKNLSYHFEPVTDSTLEDAVGIIQSAFPDYQKHVLRGIFKTAALAADQKNVLLIPQWGIRDLTYLLARADHENGVAVGVTGHYGIPGQADDIWIGFTGVLPKARGKGCAKAMVAHIESLAYEFGASHVRLWTKKGDRYPESQALYTRLGFQEEPYRVNCTDDKLAKVVVFSKSVPGEDFVPWQTRPYKLDCETI